MTRRTALIALVAIAFVYLFATLKRAETLLFDKQVAYVYHSGTDELYEVSIRPLALKKSDLWNPFARLVYHEVERVEPLGQLKAVLAELELDRHLRSENPEAWQAKLRSQSEGFVSEARRQLREGFEFTDLAFYPRSDLTLGGLLPRELQALVVYSMGDVPGVMVGDAVVVRWRQNGPVEERALNGAVFIRDRDAVRQISATIGH